MWHRMGLHPASPVAAPGRRRRRSLPPSGAGPSAWRWPVRPRVLGATMLAALIVCGLPACATKSPTGPSCVEEKLAAGTAYHYDLGLALAAARALAVGNDDLQAVVDATADYYRQSPDYETLDPLSDHRWGDEALQFILVFAYLSSHPDLVTPRLTEHLAASAQDGGMRDVISMAIAGGSTRGIGDEDEMVAIGPVLEMFSENLISQREAVREAGLEGLPRTTCPSEPGFGPL